MASDSTKTIVAMIVVAMILAASTPFLVNRAYGLSLRPSDIGSYWHEDTHTSGFFTGNNSFERNLTFWDNSWLSNKTSIISAQLLVFKSSAAIINLFPGLFYEVNSSNPPARTVEIGDGGLIIGPYGSNGFFVSAINGQPVYVNGSNVVVLEFMKGNVVSVIALAVKGIDTPPQSWIKDFVLDIGFVQLQKIDRYLAG